MKAQVLAFDLGTTSAFATNTEPYGGPTAEREWHFAFGSENFGKGGRREVLPRFKTWVRTQIGYYHPDLVMFERPFARGQAATRMLWGMAGIIEAEAGGSTLALVGDTPPATIKNHIVGTGKATKEQVMEAVSKRGYWFNNEHEADAIALMLYSLDNMEVTNG